MSRYFTAAKASGEELLCFQVSSDPTLASAIIAEALYESDRTIAGLVEEMKRMERELKKVYHMNLVKLAASGSTDIFFEQDEYDEFYKAMGILKILTEFEFDYQNIRLAVE